MVALVNSFENLWIHLDSVQRTSLVEARIIWWLEELGHQN